jgi:hypothetical protein
VKQWLINGANMSNTIFTNCGKLGDMFLCLPVISWYKKIFGTTITFALADHFPYAKDAYELLMMQDCIDDVIYFKYDESKCEHRNAGNLGKYHITKGMLPIEYQNFKIYSFGFHRWPDKYISELYAEEYGFKVDYDFVLYYGSKNLFYKNDNVKVDRYESPMLEEFNSYIPLSQHNTMVENLQYASGAKEVLTFTTGFSIMASLARIPITIFGSSQLVEHHKKYYDISDKITWINY